MYRSGQLRDISEVSEVRVKTIQQSRHLGPFTHPLSSSPSADDATTSCSMIVVLVSEFKNETLWPYLKAKRLQKCSVGCDGSTSIAARYVRSMHCPLMPCRKNGPRRISAITTTRLPAIKNYVKSVVGDLNIAQSTCQHVLK